MAIDIPNYSVLEKLGEGFQSRIFRARCMRSGKDYAVKIVKIIKPEDAKVVELLRSEHAIGSALDHPVIRKIYELRIMRQRLRVRGAILFMEYVPGITMADRRFQCSHSRLLAFFREVAEGLTAMHAGGFVHADLKPENILITPDEQVKLIDLGQSSKLREAKTKVQGTIHYMAPEQAQRGILDERTDVFGLGAALHRVLTGKSVPTEMNQTVDIHSQSLVGKRVEQINSSAMEGLPACLVRLITDCCQHNPTERIRNMPALLERIALAQTVLHRVESEEEVAPVSESKSPEQAPSNETKVGSLEDELTFVLDPDDAVDYEDVGDLD